LCPFGTQSFFCESEALAVAPHEFWEDFICQRAPLSQ
jgi:hypothetical protein